jgi:hypothetical protein
MLLQNKASIDQISASFPIYRRTDTMPLSHAPARVAVAGSFREEVKSAVLRWLRQNDNTGTFLVEKGLAFISSSIGKREENQDRALFLRLRPQVPEWPAVQALVLCDGMGGMIDGATAAELALSSFVAAFSGKKSGKLVDQLRMAVEVANDDVYRRFGGRGGSTLSAVAASGSGELAGVNVGDSRIYGVSINSELQQYSKDDTLATILPEESAASLQGRMGELLQFVGMGKGIVAHAIDLRSSPSPFKCLFLSSDGAHGIDAKIFTEVVKNSGNVIEIAKRLTILAEWTGGKDNATVAIWDGTTDSLHVGVHEGHGSLELWGVQGKYELTTRQDSAAYFRGRDSEPVRRSSRRTSTKPDRVPGGSPSETSGATTDIQQSVDLRADDAGVDTSLLHESSNKGKPQLLIEVLEE